MDEVGVTSVDVRADLVAQQRHADRLLHVVEQIDLARVLRVPDQVVAVLWDGRHPVRAIEDARAVDRVRHGVLRPEVVPGVLVLRPDVLEVGHVRVVERLEQLGVHHLAHHAGARKDEVEGLTGRADLRQHLVVVAVRRHLHLDAVLFTEGLHDPRGHVLVVVQDLEGTTGLGIESVIDGWVAVLDRQRHRTVGPSQRIGRGAVLCLLRVVVAPQAARSGAAPSPTLSQRPPRSTSRRASCGLGALRRGARSVGSKFMPRPSRSTRDVT